MRNNEDYLDSLLNNVTKKLSEFDEDFEQKKQTSDAYMTKKNLPPKTMKALETVRENQFLREFEDELLSYQIDPRKGFIFVDVREPAEIDKLKKATNGTTLLIRRDSAEASKASNHADANVLNYEYDYVIDNNQTFEDLEVEAKRFIKNLTSFQNSDIVNT